MTGFICLSETACYKAHNISQEFGEAWAFTKQLTSLNKHPIIFNFKSNLTAIRLLLGYTDRKFRKLVNIAMHNRLIYMKGDNLHLHGKQADRRLFGRLKHKQEIKRGDIKSFYQIAVLKNNVRQQRKIIQTKESTMNSGRGISEPDTFYNLHNRQINEVTLSIRKIAELFNISVSHAYALSKRLRAFGLTLTLNKVSITKDAYEFYKSLMFHNARVTANGQYYYLKASIPTFGDFYKQETTATKVNKYYLSEYW